MTTTPSEPAVDPIFALNADLCTHHVEGIAREGGTEFAVKLITQVEGNLWQGGCFDRLPLRGFKHVVSLYWAEAYLVNPRSTSVLTVPLYDSSSIEIDRTLIDGVAAWVNAARANGPTLVHCQAGLNRSSLIVARALMLAGRSADEAIALIRETRSPACLCNASFEAWLRAI